MLEREIDMSGRICLVTGASSGIGEATARGLAGLGATVVVVGRNPRRCADSVAAIKRATGNGLVEHLVADLSVQAQIRDLAARFKAKFPRLDVLVNNAGARFLRRTLSADGLEMTFALNHLGYFTLTNLLLRELLASGQGRVINVASEAHRYCPGLDFEDLQSSQGYDGKTAYARSKLANLYFTFELARQLEGTTLTVNAVDPGNVLTNFSRNNGWLSWMRHIIGSLRASTVVGPREGARTGIYLASSPQVRGITGKYFAKEEIVDSSEASLDAAAGKRLWEISLRLAKFTS